MEILLTIGESLLAIIIGIAMLLSPILFILIFAPVVLVIEKLFTIAAPIIFLPIIGWMNFIDYIEKKLN